MFEGREETVLPDPPADQPGTGRSLLDTGFGDDDGTADPRVTAALEAYDARPDELERETLAVLQDARLLVPVVAVLGEVEVGEEDLV